MLLNSVLSGGSLLLVEIAFALWTMIAAISGPRLSTQPRFPLHRQEAINHFSIQESNRADAHE
ncbi:MULTISPECIES: hypothetical protein [Micrococcaceae]|uniref:hypothetical protein n=1 Tax=Micrococcaceae TaxID=1268 RepID=UPI001142E9D2|nr:MULTISPECIES: hypothetical protein [Micrococcaceae]